MRALQVVTNWAIAILLASVMVPVAAAAEDATGTAGSGDGAAHAATAPLHADTQSVHVQVGRSVIINTQVRLRRIVVSSPEVLETSIVSPTQVVVTAKAPGSSSLVLWDENSNTRIVDVFSDINISGLRDGIRAAYPDQPVKVEAEEGKVIVTGTVTGKEKADAILGLANIYSKNVVNSLIVKPVHEKQILLKVQFAEVDRAKAQQFGLNILSLGAAGNVGSTTTGQFGTRSSWDVTGTIGAPLSGFTSSVTDVNPLNIFVFRPDLNLGTMIQDLQQKNVLQILAEPNIMALNGQTAKFLAGGEFPVPIVQGGTAQSTAISIQFKPYGVKLEFTGTIDGNKIRLKLAPEVSTIDLANGVTLEGFRIPAVATRKAETEIELTDGQTFAMAGLLDKRTTVTMSKMPGIGDIPILGELFKSHDISKTDTDLVVLVTPVIVDPVNGDASPAAAPKQSLENLDNQKFDEKLGANSGMTKLTDR
jgi:pilus assembly protein CpaC